jgi:hypothetical protein
VAKYAWQAAMSCVSGKASGRQRGENISAGKRAEALPKMCPLQSALEELREMTRTQVNVKNGDNDNRVPVQDEAGQRKHETQSSLRVHLNSSTAAYGSTD